MCLGKVLVTEADVAPREIEDVVDIRTDETGVSISTLFGEQHRFEGLAIDHVAMRSGVIVSLARVA